MAKGINITQKDGRRVVEGLGYYETHTTNDLRDVVKNSTGKFGSAMAFKFKDDKGKITGKTHLEFDRDIDSLGTSLLSMGLKDSRIAIIGENRYEWGVCYFSVVNGAGVAVPLDKYLPQNEVENLIDRGKVDAIFYSPQFHNMMVGISKKNERLKQFICMAKNDASEKEAERFYNVPDLIEKGGRMLDAGDKTFTESDIDREKMSVLLFTSGTTSISKGVMLSHTNIASNVQAMTSIIYAGPGDVHLSLLPLHHTFENNIGLAFMVNCGVCIAYCDGIKHIVKNMREYGVTILVAVPAILEVMYRRLQEGIEKSGKAKAFNLMIRLSEFLLKLGIDVRKKIFKSVLEQLGPKLRLAVSGAAPLDPEVIVGFGRIGLNLIQGYGLTETSPVISACNDFVNIAGTIGYPLAGIEVAIDNPDESGMGEIIARGKNVMLGYYEDAEATAEAIDSNGWFRTGDLGIIDEKGILRITGRAKSMIVFTNGKKAFPEEYEVLINNISGVKDSFAWGNKAPDGDVQVCAEIVIDKAALSEGKNQIVDEKALAARFDAEIKAINKNLPQYKIIRYFVLTEEDLIKTSSLKIKRNIEFEKIKGYLDKARIDMRKSSGKFVELL